MLIYSIAAIFLGFMALVWSADKFVDGASATARLFGLSPLVVGVVIVGIGTSAPEMLVSGIAAANGNSGIAIGNALGSNITNVGLILGVTAICYPLLVKSRIIQREIPLLAAVMLASYFLMLDGELSRLDGALLFSGLIATLVWSMLAARHGDDILAAEFEQELQTDMSKAAAITWVIAGLLLLVITSRILVWGAVNLAQLLGISDLIIGLTIIALGTSLPELAASLTAARKAEYDIAVGNVVGSNLFNLLGVLALPGLINPGVFDPAIVQRDYPVMGLLTLLLLLFASNFTLRKQGQLSRGEGTVLLLLYLGYTSWLVYSVIESGTAIAS